MMVARVMGCSIVLACRVLDKPRSWFYDRRPFMRAMGLIPCHTPRRSPQSNGLAEDFFGSFKRDYVYQACLDTLEELRRQVLAWIDHYSTTGRRRTAL